MSALKVKANWEDSSDEEIEETVVPCASAAVAVLNESVTSSINRCDCFACISDSYEIEKYISETGFPPQCESKLEADKQYNEDKGYDDEDEGYDEYEEDEYDDHCDMVDKKMGNYVKCR
jgi:hypothetical protein